MQSGPVIKAASLLIGAALALLGGVFFYAYAVGDFVQGRSVAIFMGISLILASTPIFAFAFSTRAAKFLLVVLLFAFAAALLWMVFFNPAQAVARPWIYQTAAISFAVLLVIRVGLALRRSHSGQGT
jgi:hypothetical protein